MPNLLQRRDLVLALVAHPNSDRTDATGEPERAIVSDGIELRQLDSDQITDAIAEEMIAVFRTTFSPWPRLDPGVSALEYVRWKTSGPMTRMGSIQARIDGRLVFATTSWASWMRIGGTRRLRIIFSDTGMDPAYQGRGIYSKSVAHRTRLVRERYDLSLHERGSSRRNDRPLARKGQTPVANVVTAWHRILRPLAWSTDRELATLAPLALALAAAGNLATAARRGTLRRQAARRGTASPRPVERFDHRFDALFEAAATAFDVIGERTQELLSWRYGDRRAGPFVVRSIADGGLLLGYAVLRLAGARAFLADVLALPGRTDVVEALIADAVEIARAAGACGIEAWLSRRHPYRGALSRQGFFDSRVDQGVAYHPVAASADDLRVLRDPRARVHFQLGDTDLV